MRSTGRGRGRVEPLRGSRGCRRAGLRAPGAGAEKPTAPSTAGVRSRLAAYGTYARRPGSERRTRWAGGEYAVNGGRRAANRRRCGGGSPAPDTWTGCAVLNRRAGRGISAQRRNGPVPAARRGPSHGPGSGPRLSVRFAPSRTGRTEGVPAGRPTPAVRAGLGAWARARPTGAPARRLAPVTRRRAGRPSARRRRKPAVRPSRRRCSGRGSGPCTGCRPGPKRAAARSARPPRGCRTCPAEAPLPWPASTRG